MRQCDEPTQARGNGPSGLTRLAALLQMAGPSDAAEILTRLDQDLVRAATDLARARATASLPDLRAVTHVLISVAGTVGATGLSDDARRLNDQCHREAPDPALADLVATGLSQLILAVRATRAAQEGAA